MGGVIGGFCRDGSCRVVLFSVLFREVCANFVSFFVSFLTGCGDSAYLIPRFNLLQPCDSTAVGVCFSAGGLLAPDASRTSIRSLLVAVAASGMLNRAVEERVSGTESLLFGRPRGRRVDSKPKRRTVRSLQESSPNGLPRRTLRRAALNSASGCGPFTNSA